MWPYLLLIPIVGFVGASFLSKGSAPARIPDSLGQTQSFSVNAPADGSAAPADYLLNKPFASPNGVAPTLPEWYDIMRGAPDDFGFNDMFIGPASKPGGKLNSILPPNYTAPIAPPKQSNPIVDVKTPVQAPSQVSVAATKPQTVVTSQPAPVVTTQPVRNITVAPAPAPAPVPVVRINLGHIPGVNAPLFS